MRAARILAPPPPSVVKSDGTLAFGAYRGPLPGVDLSRLRTPFGAKALHHKRWMYVTLAADEVFVAAAVVHLGYATNAFVFAHDPSASTPGALSFERSITLPGPLARVRHEGAPSASVRSPLLSIRIEPTATGHELTLSAPGAGRHLELAATLTRGAGNEALSVVAPVGGGTLLPHASPPLFDATEKQALLDVEGTLTLSGRKLSLAGGLAGFDYTEGLLGRHTEWKWAYGLGRAHTGERVAFNLTEGFVGPAECAVWVDGALHPVGPATIGPPFAPRSLDRWRMATTASDEVDLTFHPRGMHAEDKELGVVRSSFVQPCGRYEGTLHVGGKRLTLDRTLGVAERQDVRW